MSIETCTGIGTRQICAYSFPSLYAIEKNRYYPYPYVYMYLVDTGNSCQN